MLIDRIAAFFTAAEFTWRDALDVLLVAFIIYQLLKFLRGTHAVQMALGAFVLVVLYWTSLLFNLETGQLRYCIKKSILSEDRLQRQRAFYRWPEEQALHVTYFGDYRTGHPAEPFALLHREF